MRHYVVDTHALLWFLTGSARLGNNAAKAMADPASKLILPAIALAEALWISHRVNPNWPVEQMIAALDSDHRFSIQPLTREIVEMAHQLESMGEMHDRQIAATALLLARELALPVGILTRDKEFSHSGVQVVW